MFFLNKNKSKEKIKLKYIEIQIVDHCNLNCSGCTHFSNIAEPYYITVEDYEKYVAEISQKFNIGIIRIIGGEPLLHPQITDIIKITRKYLQKSAISIVTNGILLSGRPDTFWKTIKDNNIIFDVSVYPVNENIYKKSFELLKKYNIEFHYKKTDFFLSFLNINGNYNKKSAFKNCPVKKCTILYKGYIYHCPITSCLEIYNKKFNTNLKGSNGISIEKSANEIIKYLKTPIETCKYCVFDEDNVKIKKWGFSEQKPEEWY